MFIYSLVHSYSIVFGLLEESEESQESQDNGFVGTVFVLCF
jgi:hypothetical protein